MGETTDYLTMFAHFPFALRRFLHRKLTLDEARRIVRERMDRREENLLHIAERCIYGHASSPYLALLKWAGCELGDLRNLVRQKGVEGGLRDLRAAGVYVTYEEFKGRRPIERNGLTLPVKPSDFDNPHVRRDFTVQSSGSTGAALQVGQNLDFLADGVVHHLLAAAAHGTLDAPIVMWAQMFPGTAMRRILQLAYMGQRPARWFSPIGWRDSKYWLKYDVATLYMLFWMRVFGLKVPLPEIVKPDQAVVIARAICELIQRYGRCVLYAGGVSNGVRVAVAAMEAGIDLSGAVFRMSGEPPTPAKVKAIHRSGARTVPGYAMTESGALGTSCVHPCDGNDIHLWTDIHALFSYPITVDRFGVTVPAFHVTSLLDTASKLLFNVQTDDYGIVEERACGCELERLGFTTHLREMRSYSKLVGEGITLLGTEMEHIVEEVLPSRFGGTPLDYQLVEEEDGQGFTRLSLYIHPRLAIADEQQVIEAMYQALGESSSMADAARMVWQQRQTIQVKREPPIATARGKVLPLHIQRRVQDVPTSKENL